MHYAFFRRGLTLVEVIAALGLLSTLLVATIAGFRGQSQQILENRLRLDALELADRLMYDWLGTGNEVPAPKRGRFSGRDDLEWETFFVDKSFRSLGLDVVRLEVRSTQSNTAQVALVSLDVFVAAPPTDLDHIKQPNNDNHESR